MVCICDRDSLFIFCFIFKVFYKEVVNGCIDIVFVNFCICFFYNFDFLFMFL